MTNDSLFEATFQKVIEMNSKYDDVSMFPIAILSSLDGTAKGKLISLLNQAIADLIAKVAAHQQHIQVCYSQVISNAYPIVLHDFKKIGDIYDVPMLAATGNKVALSQGIDLCTNMLLTKNDEKKKLGYTVVCPWLISIASDEPTDWKEDTQQRLSQYVKHNSIFHIALQLGNNNTQYFPSQVTFDINEFNIKQCFTWIANTIIARMNSREALKIKIPDFTNQP